MLERMKKVMQRYFCKDYLKKTPKFIPDDISRLQLFFCFCSSLENHPFIKNRNDNIRVGYTLTLENEEVQFNFDEVHLESLLTRLRQFYFNSELFYLKDLRRAATNTFTETNNFKKFYDKLWSNIKTPLPPDKNLVLLKGNGNNATEGYTIPQLIETCLYTGAIHSNNLLDPNAQAHFDGISKSDILVLKHISAEMAFYALDAVQDIFSFRYHILLLARASNKVGVFKELEEFNKQRELEDASPRPIP